MEYFAGFGAHWPYLALFLTLLFSGTGAPIPEEVAVVAAGILSAQGILDPIVAFFVCLSGAVLGDCLIYYLGHHFGKSVLREHRLWTHFITPEREAQMEEVIRLHGLKVLFMARFLVGIRAGLYLAAGVLRVPFRRFVITDAISAAVVVGIFFAISYRYGDRFAGWLRQIEVLLTIIVLATVAVAIVYFWQRYRRQKQKGEKPEEP